MFFRLSLKIGIVLMIHLFVAQNLFGQITPPYLNTFDNPSDTIGWSHYALTGFDNWENGTPGAVQLNSYYSPTKVWATKLDSEFDQNSTMCLESPYFDLSDTTINYRLGFVHQYETASYQGGNIEFTLDSGATWQLLDGQPYEKFEWYNNPSCSWFSGEPTWSYNYYSSFKTSYHLLDTVSGESDVKFRFKFGGNNNSTKDGWVIDNFIIEENLANAYAFQQQPIHISPECATYDINLELVYGGVTNPMFLNSVNYYWSDDNIFDGSDTLIGNLTQNISSSLDWDMTFNTPTGLSSGTYYIFFYVDADSSLTESNESDNLGMATVVVDSISTLPVFDHFEDSIQLFWSKKGNSDWQLGEGLTHHIEGTHSGEKSWYISSTLNVIPNYLESQRFDASQNNNVLVSFWYKSIGVMYPVYFYPVRAIDYCNDDTPVNVSLIPPMVDDDWHYFNVELPASVQNSTDVRIQIFNCGQELLIDDIYIGPPKADLSIEKDKHNRFTSSSNTSDSLVYYLTNSGMSSIPITATHFYWSTDSILDGGDVFLGSKNEPSLFDTTSIWTGFSYNKPTTTPGTYYIIYILDEPGSIDEMREINNIGFFILNQHDAQTIPYYNDFEVQIDNWRHNASFGGDEWEWTTPTGSQLNQTFSGQKCWVTNDTGAVSPMTRMHLYTPVFDLSTTTNPVIEFDMELQPNHHLGNANMSYSIDGGATWQVLDTTSLSFNRWYYPISYVNGYDNLTNSNVTDIMFDPTEKSFTHQFDYNSRDVKRNTRYILDIGFLSGADQVQFRFNLAIEENQGSYTLLDEVEGLTMDNFEIREAFTDLTIDYKKSLMISSESDYIEFYFDVKNQGNFLTEQSYLNVYVSVDSLLDGSDYYLGWKNIDLIRPDMYFHLSTSFGAPVDLENYNYLIFELDPDNNIQESDELNNIIHWPLSLDSINTYPYLNEFSDSIVNGWNYSSSANYRIRNLVAPAEYLYQTDIQPFEMYTEQIPNTPWFPAPYFYLVSPAFNFSQHAKIELTFDLFCTGVSDGGGNLDFSTDGGNSWQVLDDTYGNSFNWYNWSTLSDLNNEPGWGWSASGLGSATLDSVYYDISFLGGEENVVFRFKHRSNHHFQGAGSPQGLRLDNFLITGDTLDYVALDSFVNVNATLAQQDINISYNILNTGVVDGVPTETKFYWSIDSLLDSSDQLIDSIGEVSITGGSTLSSNYLIQYPAPVTQYEYYLFYETDGDHELAEANEGNNNGSFKITFDSLSFYSDISDQTTFDSIEMYVYEGKLHFRSEKDFGMSSYHIYSGSGQLIYAGNVVLNEGIMIKNLPNQITHGVYQIRVINECHYLNETIRVVLN